MSFRPLIRLAKMSRRVNLYHKLLTFFKNKERNRNGWQMRKRSYYNFKLQIISKVCLLNNRWITCWLNKPDHSWAKSNGPLSKHHNDAFGFFLIIIYFYNSADEKKWKSITIKVICLYGKFWILEKNPWKVGLNSFNINLLKKLKIVVWK